MSDEDLIQPNYLFEVSWEVCNKVGGIHTVITTKAMTLLNELGDRLIMIGPDVWKGQGEHPEFAEDKNLLAAWKNYAESTGLRIKIGRWKITGNPIAVLIDFTPLYTHKDEILAELWLNYKVDSLAGQWDYIEPALFGYAAGKVIETFYHFHLTLSDKIIAQFHEWMMGAGVLYLKGHVPQIATVFTTHATVVGRALAGNGMPFYSQFDTFNADTEARNFNCVAKHSLEKVSANNADCFTTVSEITARECERFLGKKPDVITPNGFEDIIVPDPSLFKEKRAIARKKLFSIAKTLTGDSLPDNTMLILKSGRYEFKNKGIDVFIDAIGALDKNPALDKEVLAFIFIPANTTGPRRELKEALETGKDWAGHPEILTHYLQGAESDPIMTSLHKNGLYNKKENKVKVVFAPVYLDGNDGIFNINYYDLITGFDISVFPSYYEPWGYTPLESVAFHIPTITTNLTGFGMAIHPGTVDIDHGIAVIDRNDNNRDEVVTNIAATLLAYTHKTVRQVEAAREAAGQLSKAALWKNLIVYYKTAYSIALKKADGRSQQFKHGSKVASMDTHFMAATAETQQPVWRKIFVQSQLPESLDKLGKLSRNLWWTWNKEAVELFEMIDKDMWWRCDHNPIMLLNVLSLSQIKKLEKNVPFNERLKEVYQKFENYMHKPVEEDPHVAYFCMEYGLDSNLKIYSGGLGILAGDHLKEASDKGRNLTGVGLLYRQGYFRQNISIHGEQEDTTDPHRFTRLPLIPIYDSNGNWLTIGLSFPGRTLYAKVWKVEVGRVDLYLLDTDIIENTYEDRAITAQLYGGDNENRLRQELLLGVGGVRMLQVLGLNASVYHYNEGHAAFAGFELIRMLVQGENLSFDEALEVVKSSTLFTTHTPVPAGHDTFSEGLLRVYLSQLANNFNISWKKLMGLGRVNENDSEEKFSMSNLAARLSQEMNGVSALHGEVSRKMFSPLWSAYASQELHVGHVTNGVHLPTWTSPKWQELYEQMGGGDFVEKSRDKSIWEKIYEVPDKTIWDLHSELKKELLLEVVNRVQNDASIAYQNREKILYKLKALDEKTLVFGFARRFVSYKRALLLFQDPEKIANIIKNAGCPVLFLFAGKAHPQDKAGKDIIRQIIEISEKPEFQGNVIFLHNYDIVLAKHLTRSVDVWLNTPELYMEASGTSGMKALANGVLNFSMRDGWWAEAYREDCGWAIGGATNQANPDIQYELDANSLYYTLEQEIIPLYMDRNKDGVPEKWVGMVKNSIHNLLPQYSMMRTLDDYDAKFYFRIKDRAAPMRQDNFARAKEIAHWKNAVTEAWPHVQVLSAQVYDSANKALPTGSTLSPRVEINTGGLSANDIGAEIVFVRGRYEDDKFGTIVFKQELLPEKVVDDQVSYSAKIPVTRSGVYEYVIRIYPKNPLLIYREDMPLAKWA